MFKKISLIAKRIYKGNLLPKASVYIYTNIIINLVIYYTKLLLIYISYICFIDLIDLLIYR